MNTEHGLLLGTEAAVMTPSGIHFSFPLKFGRRPCRGKGQADSLCVVHQARALLQSDQVDLALQTAKQAFEQQRTQELQQVGSNSPFQGLYADRHRPARVVWPRQCCHRSSNLTALSSSGRLILH